MFGFWLMVTVVYVMFAALIASKFDSIAVAKGYEEKDYFWWCFWLNIAGWLMVVALPDKNQAEIVKNAFRALNSGDKCVLEKTDLPQI